MIGIRDLPAVNLFTNGRNGNKEPQTKKIAIKTLDEARTYVNAQRLTDKTQARQYLEKLHGEKHNIGDDAFSLLTSVIRGEMKRLPDSAENANQRGADKTGQRHFPADPGAADRRAPSHPLTLGVFSIMHGLCSSQPRVDEHYTAAYGDNTRGLSHRTAVFDQLEALERFERGHPGACAIYSTMWLKQIGDCPSDSAAARTRFLEDATADVIARQREYADRVDEANQRSYEVEDPFYATIRSLGVRPGAEDNLLIDIIGDEEGAMNEIANVLSSRNSSNLLWLARPDDSSASGHIVASHAHGDRVALFDPNLGEFRARRDEIPAVMRAIIGASSTDVPIPDVMIVRVYP